MTDIRIETFQLRDILEAKLRPEDLETVKHWGSEYFTEKLRACEYSDSAPSYSVFVGDKLLLVGGVVNIWPGVAESWCIGTTLTEKYPIAFYKVVRYIHDEMIEIYNLHRLQCNCWEGHKRSLKWLGKMGFSIEGFMRSYSTSKDGYYLLAKVIK